MAIIAQSYGVFLRRWRHFLRRIQAWLSPRSFPLRSHAEQRVPVRQQAQRKNSVVVKTQAQEAKCLDFICSSATSFLDDRSQVSRVRFFFFQAVSVPSVHTHEARARRSGLCAGSPRNAELRRNAAACALPCFAQAKGDDLVRHLDPCQRGFRSRNGQKQLCCSGSKPTLPDGPWRADSGRRCLGRKAKSG